jgi:tetratricopeptide (TPR) repeat protein
LAVDKSTVIQNAQKYTAKGQLDKAIEEWQKLIAETPNDGNIYNTIGDLHLKNNSPKEAIEVYLKAAAAYNEAGFALKTIAVYKKIIKIDPQRMDTYVKLADLHAERGLTGNAIEDYLRVAKHYAREGKVRESLDIYRKIADLDPTNVNIQIKLSELCLKEGLKTDALEGLLKAAEKCSSQGKNTEAESLYARALQIDPQNQVARTHVKETSVSSGQSVPESFTSNMAETPAAPARVNADQNEMSLRETLKKPEATATQRQQLGYFLLKKGDLEGALHEFRQVVQEYHHEQQWGPAIQVLKDFLQKDPKRIEAHELLAQSYEKSKVIDRAVEEYVTVIDLMIREEHSMTEAMEHFKRIQELDPKHPVIQKLKVRFGTGVEPPSETSMSQREASLSSAAAVSSPVVETTGSGSKETIQSYLTEAEVYLKYGLSGKALEQLQIALKIAPDHPEVHLHLKEVYKLDGKISEVVEECLLLAQIYAKNRNPDLRRQVLEEALTFDSGNEQVKGLLNPASAATPQKTKPQGTSELSQSRKSIDNQASVSQSVRSIPNISLGPKEGSSQFSTKEKARSEPIPVGQSSPHLSPGLEESTPEVLGKVTVPSDSQKLSSEITREVEERFAEAEFYLQQGLKQEAKQLYQRVVSLRASHVQAQARLSELELNQNDPVVSEIPAEPVKSAPPASQPKTPTKAQKMKMPVHEEGDINLAEMFMDDFGDKPKPEVEAGESSKPESIDPAQKELESLFSEFKKGVQAQFGDEDYETRYNLGIAYMEMGLVKEAIEEFQLASKGQSQFVDAVGMIAVCYKEAGDYEQAAKQLQAVLQDERCTDGHAIGLKYELGQLYELMGRKKEALDLFTEVYKMDQSFKDVAQKLKEFKNDADPDLAEAGTKTRRGQEPVKPQPSMKKKKKVSYL